jgi:FKBP-type peptidyl-prolyl cis-trans isomerase
MKVGGKRKLVIGSALAYGNQSPDTRTIPNNATLVFDVELLAVR